MDRPSLQAAITERRSDGIVVVRPDRLARNVVGGLTLLQQAKDEGWSLFFIEPDTDTTTAVGWLMIANLFVMAEFEARIGSERTKSALAARKARGVLRPTDINPDTVALIESLRADGLNYSEIARYLTAAKIPTARGGSWAASTVKSVLDRTQPRE